MRPHSSSTSSSDARRSARLRAVLGTILWTVLALVGIEVVLQLAFPMPDDPRQRPGSVAQYFNYGMSIEGKLERLVGPTDETSAPIVVAGWIDRECRHDSAQQTAAEYGITIYGMSFSGRVADHLRSLRPDLPISTHAGPGAPLNHSYACFRAVEAEGNDRNKVQIIGILASSVSRLMTIGGLTTSFEAPAPFTYPRYHLEQGRLVAVEPVVRDPADIRDTAKMAAYKAQLSREDAFYNSALFDGSVFDHSTLANLLRRSYAQSEERSINARLAGLDGDFRTEPEISSVMQAMVSQFAQSVRQQGGIPIIILFQDRTSAENSLYRMLGETLNREQIPYVHTNDLVNVKDTKNFVPDGHFTPENDRKIAEATLRKIEDALATR